MTAPTRQVSPLLAVLAGLIGLGYVYVARIQWAIALIVVSFSILAIAGWSSLVFDPHGMYAVATAGVLVAVVAVIHPALIAFRNRTLPARPYNRWWFYVLWLLATWLLTDAMVANRPVFFGYEPFRVPAGSMAPTIQEGDFIMSDAWYFDRADPDHGDLVIYESPGSPPINYVKRIVGLPGDRIEIRHDVLIRNGMAIDEDYLLLISEAPGMLGNFGPVVTPEGQYFVLGDNRHNSKDSRFVGAVDREWLRGRVIHRWFAYNDGIRWERFPEMLVDDDTEENVNDE